MRICKCEHIIRGIFDKKCHNRVTRNEVAVKCYARHSFGVSIHMRFTELNKVAYFATENLAVEENRVQTEGSRKEANQEKSRRGR